MFWNKYRSVKRGYALVYTLMLCSICIVLVLFIFDMEVKVTKNTLSYKNYILKNSEYEDLREILFTKLFNSIYTNVTLLNSTNLKNYFASSHLYYRTDDSKACIKYDATIDKVVYECVYDINNYRKDMYDYKIIKSKVRLVFLRSTYIKGAIE
jgi:hypothetical protein